AALPRGDRTVVGIGDDAAVLTAPDSRVVATTDLLVEGRHFRRDWSSAADIGGETAPPNAAPAAAPGASPRARVAGVPGPGGPAGSRHGGTWPLPGPVSWSPASPRSAPGRAPRWSVGTPPAPSRSCSRSPPWATWPAGTR